MTDCLWDMWRGRAILGIAFTPAAFSSTTVSLVSASDPVLMSGLCSWVTVTLMQSLQETSVVGRSTVGMAMPGWFLLISFMNHRLKWTEE